MTQQEVAQQLRITRVRVIWLLSKACWCEIVKISIKCKVTENVEIEHRLLERFKHIHTEVVLGMTEDETALLTSSRRRGCTQHRKTPARRHNA
jgi:DNA-binding transcriptional regulator LsrR (DeoR family)